jgi:hypothetical protein
MFIAPKHIFIDGGIDGDIGSESKLFAQESEGTDDSEYSSDSESSEPSPPSTEPSRTVSSA